MGAIVLKASNMLAEYTFDGNSAAASNVAAVVDMGSWIANRGQIGNRRAEIDGDKAPNAIDLLGDAYHQLSFTVQKLGVGESLILTSVLGQYSRDGTHSNGS